ncbi:AMIN-like domain-containing (lipo)protein [Rhodococcus sp. CH91]|uniref:AMIN-like domain-containing (lipo)protein n=1 Tax=Rhodococcus sp. CH91 TaxID=2910256 RepID=UPI001F4A12D8|nr:hypothetical protein [Rhodococcus sp. CH91]
MVRTRIALAVTATALVLGGCSAGADEPAPSPAASVDTPTSSAAPTTTSANTPRDARDKVSAAEADAKLTVVDIRTGRHDGFDRVVYELGGEGMPGWRVGYVDEAIQDGSGNPVAVAGDAVLQVLIDGSAYPFDSGVEQYDGPNPVLAEPGGSVVEVNGSGVFEGVTQSFVGIAEAGTPFSVYSLTGPTRVVIDVAR